LQEWIAMLDRAAPAGRGVNHPDILRQVNVLRQPDNWTNWFYLVREYLFVASVVATVIALYYLVQDGRVAWPWAVPVTLLAILLIGAGQHRLATLGHEASHYSLFRNRTLNELISDWFCMFPLFTSTQGYRLQHLAHHQYPNDPQRDPDVSQMQASGHRFRLPMPRARFLWQCVLRQALWPPNLVRYILVRAFFKPDGGPASPYRITRRTARFLTLGTVLYLVVLAGALAFLVVRDDPWLLALVPAVLLAAALTGYLLVPAWAFSRFVLRHEVSARLQGCLRVAYYTLLLTTLAWLTWATARPWWLFYLVLWVVPLGTSFSFFMILRQVVQHGNADRERLTNTRIFHVNRLISGAVFPLGMDYHLPHHLFPMVPHYNLRRLHALLQTADDYREQATLVEGYFLPRGAPPRKPTVLDLMTGPTTDAMSASAAEGSASWLG
jgi:fatty acid desaturase